MKMLAALLPLLMALPAQAQAQDPALDETVAAACMDAALGQPDAASCAGNAAGACMEAHPHGFTTVVMNGCLALEAEWWDDRLNEEYKAVSAMEEAIDADAAPPPPLAGADALRAMQRAWMDYRDARCTWEATHFGGGTGAGPAFNGCILTETARQTLLLAARRHAMETQ